MNSYLNALRRSFVDRGEATFCRQISRTHDVTVTWGELGGWCGWMQDRYRAAGLTEGDQVLIFLRHVPALYPAFFGAMLSGITPAFMPCASPRQDATLYWASHQELLDKIRPAAIVTDGAVHREMLDAGLSLGSAELILLDAIGSAPPTVEHIGEDRIALLQHSSGTTGMKKGVALSFAAIVAQCESYGRALGVTNDDVVVSWLPLYHDMGLIACLILPAFFGLPTIHIDPFLWVSRPQLLFDLIVAERGTLCWLPNFAFEHLALTAAQRAADYDLRSVRAMINCSEPCKPLTFDRFLGKFAAAGVHAGQLQCCYAMAETVYAVTQTPLGTPPRRITVDPATLGRGMRPGPGAAGQGIDLIEVGAPIEGIDISVVAEDRTALPPGTVGEIAVSGRFLFTGYNADPERTARQMQDGLYYTRDLGVVINGRLFVLGRIDDLIIINGRNLYAHEVEAALADITGLKPGRAVAIGVFNPQVGSQVLVILAERQGEDAQDDRAIRRAVMDRVSAIFEVAPSAVELMDPGALIKTTSGKISRNKNLERFLERKA